MIIYAVVNIHCLEISHEKNTENRVVMKKQVNNWFGNKRIRYKKSITRGMPPELTGAPSYGQNLGKIGCRVPPLP